MPSENRSEGQEFLNYVRHVTKGEDVIPALILIDEVRETVIEEKVELQPEFVFNVLLRKASQMDLRNPFTDEKQFLHLVTASEEGIDWELALQFEFKENRISTLPEVMVENMSSRINAGVKTVLVAEAEYFVPYLENLVSAHMGCQFTFTTSNDVRTQVLARAFAEYDNVTVVTADIYSYGFIESRFDMILSFPIFGGRLIAEDQRFLCREYDMVALENLSLHLENGGELVIVLPARVTFASGKISDLRSFVLQNYTVKEISELPVGILEFTGIKTYILDIVNSRPEDEDIVIRRYSAGERRSRKAPVTELVVQDDTFVLASELEEQGDWNLDRIFASQDEEWLQYQNTLVKKDQLHNVAQVFRGKSVTGNDPNGKTGVINISDIGEYSISMESIDHIDEQDRKISAYLLKEGDVLLPARGTAIRVGVFHEQAFPCIAHSNVIVIRPDEKRLDSIYLKVFLDSPMGKKLVGSTQQGMSVMNISYKDLENIEIPVPSMDEQKAVAEEYERELQQYIETIKRAENRWNEVLARLQKI
jgi:SAM-dependent methyltransferase